MPKEISHIEVLYGCKRRLKGSKRQVVSDLSELIKSHDPDLILLPHADTWVPLIGFSSRLMDMGKSEKSYLSSGDTLLLDKRKPHKRYD